MSQRFHLAALAVAAAAIAAPAAAQEAPKDIAGAWHGVLIAGPNVLRVVVRVTAGPDGKLAGEFLSIDQSPKGFPLTDVKVAGGALSFGLPQIAATYEGKWDAARGAWVGAWKQGPVSLPLTLDKGEFPAAAPSPAPTAPQAAGKPPPNGQTPQASGKTVEGLTVQGQANSGTRIDIDRRSYDLTKDLQAQTGSIADALRNIPSVQVDVQGNISLRGDPSVTIMIDGKPSSIFKGPNRGQILQSMPATAFERVEVMTNPSAAYRPDGSGGIINLIPRKAKQMGTAGSVRLTAAAADKVQASANVSSVGPKLTLSADAFWFHEKQEPSVDDQRSSFDPLSGKFLDSHQVSDIDQTVDQVVGRAAFDYDPDSKTRISGELRGVGLQSDGGTATTFRGQQAGTLAPLNFDRDGHVFLSQNNLTADASWRRKFGSEPDHELVVDLTEDHSTQRLKRHALQTALTPGITDLVEDIRNDTDTDQTHVKADYTRPYAGNAKLKTGYELEDDRSQFDNFGLTGITAATIVPNPALIDRFQFDQAINGVYATWQQPFDKLTVLAGLRLEDTQIDMKDPVTGFRGSNDYTRFYPSLHLAWKLDDTREIRASYSERIARPQASDYNPFHAYRDPFNFTAGNPDLKPQVTHSFELGGQYRKGFTYYLATFYFRDNEKGVTDVVTDLGGGVLLTTKENLTRSQNGGLELVAAGRWGSKWSYQVRGDAFHNEIDASDLGFPGTRSAWTMSGGGAITWQITPKDQFQLIGQVTGKRLTPQGYHEPLGLLFAGYRHQFNKDWSLSVTGRDLANSYRDTLVIDTPTLHDRQVTRVPLRAFYLQLTYSFGQGPRKDSGIDYGTPPAGAATPR